MAGMLYDMTGQCAGNWGGDTAPDGYWLRTYDAPVTMSPLAFLDKIGPSRFGAVWVAALTSPAIAFPMVRGFAAQVIHLSESFPVLKELERQGILPDGTSIEVWS